MRGELKTNSIATEDLRAINGPVPHADGRMALVKQETENQKWVYEITSINPKNKELKETSPPLDTSDLARKALSEKFTGEEKKSWTNDQFKDLTPGQPWFRQRIGEREVPAEAVFARACYTGNIDLAMMSAEKITKPNAQDANGHSLLTFAAGMSESSAPMDALLEKGADPRRVSKTGWSPSHAAAAIGDPDRVISLAKHGANPALPDKEGRSALSFLPASDRKKVDQALPKPSGPKPNPLSVKRPIKSAAPNRDQERTRDVRSF